MKTCSNSNCKEISPTSEDSNFSPVRNRGFTLIEIVVVLALIAFISSAVVMSYRGTWSRSQAAITIDRLRTLDERTRVWCLRNRKNRTLVFDLDRQRVLRESSRESEAVVAALSFPDQLKLTKMLTIGSSASSGKISVPYFEDGTSTSWFVSFKNGESELSHFVSGVAGQASSEYAEKTVKELFNALR